MVRPLSALYGLVMLAVPQRVIDFWERIAFETTGDAELRTGVAAIARLEGLAILVTAIRENGYSTLQSIFGAFGLAALLAPRQYLDFGMGIAYRNTEDIDYKSWVVPLTRILGLVFVVNAVRSLAAGNAAESDEERVVVEA